MEYNELQKIIIALDYIEDCFFCEEESYEAWVAKKNEEFSTNKYPFIMENDLDNLKSMLKNALKQIENIDINVCTEEELGR